jgi:UDP-N-acetyl-D-glucosamine dehydrogenase
MQISGMKTSVAGASGEAAAHHERLRSKIADRTAIATVCGMGYVGLPLACAISACGFPVIGADTDDAKVARLRAGQSYIKHIPSSDIAAMVETGRFTATDDFREIAKSDIVAICVPTPLNRQREPDLSYVISTATAIAENARPGQLVILESTTYPGTTVDVVAPIFMEHGLNPGRDIFLAFAPERHDPGNDAFPIADVPKVLGGQCPRATDLSAAFYGSFVKRVVPVSSPDTAEAVKLTENIFRAVNIALVNELKVIYAAMGIDIWEVIEAAKSKPFGFMPFYPGPGLGGHCIPIDPFYLTWKARQHGIDTRFVELAGEINSAMPELVVSRLAEELRRRHSVELEGSQVLVIGMAYKKNVDDLRESPTLKLLELLEARGARADYHDPFIPEVMRTREHPEFAGRRSMALTAAALGAYAAVLIATDHDDVDYHSIVMHSRLIVDTRNVCARLGLTGEKIVKA